jgi:hypothetical protein
MGVEGSAEREQSEATSGHLMLLHLVGDGTCNVEGPRRCWPAI